MVGVFAATNVFLFYVLFEVMLIPMYFLIGAFGGPAPAVRGDEVLPLLAARRPADAGLGDRAVRRLRQQLARHVRRSTQLVGRKHRPESTQMWLFLGFSIAFAIKAPLVPLHTWLPDAGAEAPVGAPCCWSACWTRSARSASCASACRCSRTRPAGFAPLVIVLARHRHPVRRAPGDGADGPEAAGRLHLGGPLRLHRPGRLRVHHAGAAPARRSTWSTTASPPARCSWWSACSSPAAAAG